MRMLAVANNSRHCNMPSHKICHINNIESGRDMMKKVGPQVSPREMFFLILHPQKN